MGFIPSLVDRVSRGVTWWSTAHSKLLFHWLSTRRSRQGRRTPALPPRNASLPEALDLYAGSWTFPCPLYPRSSCFVLWAALRSHATDLHLYLLTHCSNRSLPSVLLLFLRSARVFGVGFSAPWRTGGRNTSRLIYSSSTPTERLHCLLHYLYTGVAGPDTKFIR